MDLPAMACIQFSDIGDIVKTMMAIYSATGNGCSFEIRLQELIVEVHGDIVIPFRCHWFGLYKA